MKRDWGNTSQIVSAVSAFALCVLAFYGVFFSSTSQALVSYLQSELAVRNLRIAILEEREQKVQDSVRSAEANLKSLSEQKSEAEKQVAALNAEQKALAQRVRDLGSDLTKAAFSLVKEKINTKMSSTFNVASIFMTEKLDTPEGVPAKAARPWDDQFAYIKQIAGDLPDSDRRIGENVIANFIQQCERFKNVVIQIPALRIPKNTDWSIYGYDRSKHPMHIRLDAVMNQIEKAQQDIQNCFRGVTYQ